MIAVFASYWILGAVSSLLKWQIPFYSPFDIVPVLELGLFLICFVLRSRFSKKEPWFFIFFRVGRPLVLALNADSCPIRSFCWFRLNRPAPFNLYNIWTDKSFLFLPSLASFITRDFGLLHPIRNIAGVVMTLGESLFLNLGVLLHKHFLRLVNGNIPSPIQLCRHTQAPLR